MFDKLKESEKEFLISKYISLGDSEQEAKKHLTKTMSSIIA